MAKRAKFFVHPKALVDTSEIGAETRVWAFSHVMKGARIGKNCNIGEHCFIEQGVEVGDDVVIKNGVSLWQGVKIESKVFVGPNAVFTNDRIPRAKLYRQEYEGTIVREGASIGANATLLSRLEVASMPWLVQVRPSPPMCLPMQWFTASPPRSGSTSANVVSCFDLGVVGRDAPADWPMQRRGRRFRRCNGVG